MLALVPWQALLNGLGYVVARIYDVIGNFGLTIIVLTIAIRVVLLPLGIKQIRSMQNMQIIQPKVKAIQQKYRGNKQRQQEEIMKLYREHGVNPFSGCWPMLLQFPILIAMYSVVRFPQYPVHIPEGTSLYRAVTTQIPEPTNGVTQPKLSDFPSGTRLVNGEWLVPEGTAGGTNFLSMNLLCAASQAGNSDAAVRSKFKIEGKPISYQLNCGNSVPDRIPYYVFAFLMFATTYYQQRQMQKASPPDAASQQQQAIMRLMPLMFGVFGIFFPAGLVVYWTTSNVWQIGQQYFMLKTRPTAEQLAARADGRKERKGFMGSMMQRAEEERKRRGASPKPKPGASKNPGDSTRPGGSLGQRKPGSGGSGAGSRKKRPKR